MSKIIYKQRCNAPSNPKTPMLNRAHLKYIAERPGAFRNEGQNHGLFGQYGQMAQSGDIDDLNDALLHVRKKSFGKTNIYRAVLSMKEEDALPLGYGKREAWEKMLAREMDAIAREMGIPAHRLEWMASVHFEEGHPHAHIMFWDKEQGVKDYFTQPQKVNDIRKRLIKDIFHDEIQTLYGDKTKSSGAVKDEAADVLEALLSGLNGRRDEKAARRTFAAMSEEYAAGHLMNVKLPESYFQKIGADFLALAEAIPKKGRLNYKLMPPEIKVQIDALAREMVNGNPQCKREIDKYLSSVEGIASMYSNKPDSHKAMRDKAEDDIYKDLGNRILRAAKRFNEQVRHREREQQQIRACTFELLDEILSFLSRKAEQSAAHHVLVRGEMSKQAQKEHALKMESRGLDWEQ